MCCRKKSILITEEERKRILSLYGLLTEKVIIDEKGLKIDAKSLFDGSKYNDLEPAGKAELDQGLKEAETWLTQNKNAFITAKIRAGESKLKNQDREQNPPVLVDPGYLSKQRFLTMKRLLVPYFQNLKNSGVLEKIPVFDAPELIIGGPDANPNGSAKPGVPLDDYAKAQFVEILLMVQSPEQCLIDVSVEVMYDKTPSTDPKFGCRGGHSCDAAIFDVMVNGVVIGVANLNNAGTGDSKTSGELKITAEKAKEIFSKSENKEELRVSLKCKSGNCHSGTAEVRIKKQYESGSSIIYHECSPALERGDLAEYDILYLDPCGNMIKKGTEDPNKKGENTLFAKEGGLNYIIPDIKQYSVRSFINENPNGFTTKPKTISPYVNGSYIEVFSTGGEGYGRSMAAGKSVNRLGQEAFPAITVSNQGIKYTKDNIKYMVASLEPGITLSRIYPAKFGNDLTINYLPGVKDNLPPNSDKPDIPLDQTALGKASPSGKFYISADTNNNYFWVQGKPQSVAAQENKEAEEDKKNGIVRFSLEDQSIKDFEEFFINKNNMVKKVPEVGKTPENQNLYEVIVTQITYGGQRYDKGKKLRLVEKT
jgi:hypothetical protein